MEYLIIVIVLVVLALIAGGAMLVRGRRRPARITAPPAPPAPSAPPPAAPAGQDVGTTTVTSAPAPVAEAPAAEPAVQPLAGRMTRLRGRLARSQTGFGAVLLGLLSRDGLDDQGWEEIEDILVGADLGAAPAAQIVSELRTQVRVGGAKGSAEVRSLLRQDLIEQVGADMDRVLRVARHGDRPAVVLMVGVNGTGKTSTCGKLARALIGEGKTVLLGAADTFRAAAADQLETWGQRVGAQVVRSHREGADPASVAFDAVKQGIDERADTVIVDTAGRLHTKTGLMDELGKIKRVIERQATVDEVLLVLDATTGQNGLRQARVFAEAVDVTGIVLTKLDGTAKGGIVVAVQRELGVPVKLVGLGEGLDDLAPFEPAPFVDAILG
ncbi:MAG TPA: signal recognition particle-docking protein FtsY [Streptosporangiaceae bacterium]|jgi:fused signal recognition particle receptor|nr:signal recognition particle-docking protein FtsY [Streptosporangiaceae bacterium]